MPIASPTKAEIEIDNIFEADVEEEMPLKMIIMIAVEPSSPPYMMDLSN